MKQIQYLSTLWKWQNLSCMNFKVEKHTLASGSIDERLEVFWRVQQHVDS